MGLLDKVLEKIDDFVTGEIGYYAEKYKNYSAYDLEYIIQTEDEKYKRYDEGIESRNSRDLAKVFGAQFCLISVHKYSLAHVKNIRYLEELGNPSSRYYSISNAIDMAINDEYEMLEEMNPSKDMLLSMAEELRDDREGIMREWRCPYRIIAVIVYLVLNYEYSLTDGIRLFGCLPDEISRAHFFNKEHISNKFKDTNQRNMEETKDIQNPITTTEMENDGLIKANPVITIETENGDLIKANPVITIEMENGDLIKAELYPEIAPNTVNNFLSLVQKKFYDGLIFHRVIKGFMIQGGCPEGSGMGGPGYQIKGEFSQNGFPNDLKHTEGVLSMARAMHPDSAGSQFFIMHKTSPHLDGAYAAFGKVIEGMDVVNKIAECRTDYSDRPVEVQRIRSMTAETFGETYPEPETM